MSCLSPQSFSIYDHTEVREVAIFYKSCLYCLELCLRKVWSELIFDFFFLSWFFFFGRRKVLLKNLSTIFAGEGFNQALFLIDSIAKANNFPFAKSGEMP